MSIINKPKLRFVDNKLLELARCEVCNQDGYFEYDIYKRRYVHEFCRENATFVSIECRICSRRFFLSWYPMRLKRLCCKCMPGGASRYRIIMGLGVNFSNIPDLVLFETHMYPNNIYFKVNNELMEHKIFIKKYNKEYIKSTRFIYSPKGVGNV